MRGKLLAALVVIGILFCVVGTGQAQEKEKAAAKRIAIRAGRLIDGKSDSVLMNALILVENDRIVSVSAGGTAPAGVEVVDLSKATVLPGFVDAHTHLLLNGDITSEDYDVQLLKQSIPYRAILSARNARIALEHGFTAMRDLETEGAMYADVDIKNAIANGEVPGPRMQVATRAMKECDRERGSARAADAGGDARDDANWDVSVAGLLVGTAGAERCAVC